MFGTTKCARCLEDKDTPLRNDTMGGYVCLTCVDKELIRLQKLVAHIDDGPDEKHPNWEQDESDKAYHSMRNGNFKGWQDFARFLFEAFNEERAKFDALVRKRSVALATPPVEYRVKLDWIGREGVYYLIQRRSGRICGIPYWLTIGEGLPRDRVERALEEIKAVEQ